jgi:hypothetical protein
MGKTPQACFNSANDYRNILVRRSDTFNLFENRAVGAQTGFPSRTVFII